MREYLTGNRIANEVRMMRSQYQDSFLIVEGSTDKLLYNNFCDSAKCKIKVANNKDNALNALNILQNDDFKGVLAIVDADFSRLDKPIEDNPDLLFTDTHDLETMLLKSPALDKVLSEYGSEDKLSNFKNLHKKDVSVRLVENGQSLGYLRWISLLDQLALKFEGLKFRSFVNKETLNIDMQKLIKEVKNNSQKPSLNEKEILDRIETLKTDGHDLWQVCCGHDLICILSLGLCKAIGFCNTKEVESENIE